MAEFWEKREGETHAAYQAFALYRDMGIGRSQRKLVNEHFGGNAAKLRQINTWSAKYMWVPRVEAFDAEMERRRRIEREERIRDALERQRKSALMLQRIAVNGLQLYEANPVGEPSMTMLKFLQAGLSEERLALGIPNDIRQLEQTASVRAEVDVSGDADELPVSDDLRRAIKLVRRGGIEGQGVTD